MGVQVSVSQSGTEGDWIYQSRTRMLQIRHYMGALCISVVDEKIFVANSVHVTCTT